MLAGLAVAVPARAGLVNVGGEGQVVVGAVAAAGVALALDGTLPGGPMIVVMMLAAAAAGALWAGHRRRSCASPCGSTRPSPPCSSTTSPSTSCST